MAKFWKDNHCPQFMKIYIGFFQILGSFTMFTVEWPPALKGAMEWVQGTFKFDVVRVRLCACGCVVFNLDRSMSNNSSCA
jgi:hypothetical protein